MPSRSQRQRPGVKIIESPKDIEKEKRRKLEKLLVRALDLENQLGNNTATDDDSKASKLRSHLCEVHSEIMLANPTFASENQCFQRLWKVCFYKPISIWRQKMSREKRKRCPNLATSQEGFKFFLLEAIKLYDCLVTMYLGKIRQSSLQKQTQLSQESGTSTIFESSQLTDGSSSLLTNDGKTSKDIVPGLYKLYIYLGDLHRYAEAYNKAETNYMNASKIGPGLGNPYNQLAVVAFSKEAYCVSLYWYARSLLATHEKFSTSSANLERLFTTNRNFLLEHGRGSTPTILSANNDDASGSSKKTKKSSSNNSSNNSMVRAQKAAASKSCLTHFVDLHYDLYQLQRHEEDDEMDKDKNSQHRNYDEAEKEMNEKMNNVIASLKSLVQVSGFSDALLCKIVVINNYSFEQARRLNMTLKSSSSCMAERMSRELTFSIGVILTEQIEGTLTKALQKASSNKPAPSIRYLLPLEILLDLIQVYIDTATKDVQSQKTNIYISTTEENFWKSVAMVVNLVQEIKKKYTIERIIHNHDSSSSEKSHNYCSEIKEYQLLKGYRPLPVVNKEYLSSCEDGFVTTANARKVLKLKLNKKSQSQDTTEISKSSTSIVGGGMEENQAKLIRLLEICHHLASSDSIAPLRLNDNDRFVMIQKDKQSSLAVTSHLSDIYDEDDGNKRDEISSEVDCVSTNEIDPDENNFDLESNEDYDDEAGDVIVYKSKTGGTGEISPPPELSSAPKRTSFSVTTVGVDKSKETRRIFPNLFVNEQLAAPDNCMVDANQDVINKGDPTHSCMFSKIKPPPGFDSVSGKNIAHDEQTTAYNDISYKDNLINLTASPASDKLSLNMILSQERQRLTSAESSSLFHLPLQQQQSIIPGLNLPHSSQHIPPFNSGSEMLNDREGNARIFGGIQTANPFVTLDNPIHPSIPLLNSAMNENYAGANYNHNDSNNTDVTKFLNAGLLNSLWMDESTTNNPWAEK